MTTLFTGSICLANRIYPKRTYSMNQKQQHKMKKFGERLDHLVYFQQDNFRTNEKRLFQMMNEPYPQKKFNHIKKSREAAQPTRKGRKSYNPFQVGQNN